MDFINLQDIGLWTHVGVPDNERKTEQRIRVSIELGTDLSAAGKTDDVTDSINYADVVESIHRLAKKERKTIEKLAEDIATMILKDFAADQVKVSVWKSPPLPDVAAAGVTIIRYKTTPTGKEPRRLYA